MKRAREAAAGDAKRPYERLEYWETRYAALSDAKVPAAAAAKSGTEEEEDHDADEETTEWCLDFSDLEAVLEPLRGCLEGQGENGLVVDLGCGVSELLFEMKAAGWPGGQLLGVDFSAAAVAKMRGDARAKAQSGGGQVRFEQLDLAGLAQRFDPGSVSLFIDKMTMDTILHLPELGERRALQIIEQAGRCLRHGGAYLLVTQMDYDEDAEYFEAVLRALQHPDCHWKVEAHESDASAIKVYTFVKRARHSMGLRKKRRGPVVEFRVVSH